MADSDKENASPPATPPPRDPVPNSEEFELHQRVLQEDVEALKPLLSAPLRTKADTEAAQTKLFNSICEYISTISRN